MYKYTSLAQLARRTPASDVKGRNGWAIQQIYIYIYIYLSNV